MKLALILALLVLPGNAFAQADDYQFRFTFHKQVLLSQENGLAFWTNMPDLTQTAPHRTVVLGGWLNKDSGGWREVMGGAFVTFDGKIRPIFDVRLYSNAKQVDIYSEIFLMPDRAIIQSFASTPLLPKTNRLRAGLEWELVAPVKYGVSSKALVGPRVSLKVPKTPWLQAATVCFFDLHGGNVVRTYVMVTR